MNNSNLVNEITFAVFELKSYTLALLKNKFIKTQDSKTYKNKLLLQIIDKL